MVRDRLYIGGQWVEPAGSGTIDVVDPTTEQVIGRIPEGTADDVDRAVEAARAGFAAWREVPVESRVDACTAISAALAERADEIAALVAAEVGMPLSQARTIQAGLPAMDFGSMARVASEVVWEEQIGNSLVVREPIGVVGCLTPWNYPLHQVCAKVGPALTAGCAVIVKPSEVTPLTSFILAEIIGSLDLPEGVFNLVTGFGPVVGEAIAAHEDVDMVSLTGSTQAGRRVSEVAAQTVKRVALELGGKSANVILDDADLKTAVGYGVANCFLNSGQTCSAHTRMLVP
ncbi:MAG: aldehyde dehydrogenase family protein, partial [Solirubrobacterales bacterium]